MKKSRSSVPLFAESWELGPAPPVRKDGLFATAGRPEPEPPVPPAPALVAIAVGNTKLYAVRSNSRTTSGQHAWVSRFLRSQVLEHTDKSVMISMHVTFK